MWLKSVIDYKINFWIVDLYCEFTKVNYSPKNSCVEIFFALIGVDCLHNSIYIRIEINSFHNIASLKRWWNYNIYQVCKDGMKLNFPFLRSSRKAWLRITLFAIHSPFLLPSFFKREEKKGNNNQNHDFKSCLSARSLFDPHIKGSVNDECYIFLMIWP